MDNTDVRVEVFSTGYEPLHVTSWQEAIGDVFCGRLEIIAIHPTREIHTVSGPIPMPVQVRFKSGVFAAAIKKPHKKPLPNRSTIYSRDNGCCSYCCKDIPFARATLDHVLPKSRGGKDTWENLVLSCSQCNSKKGNRTPEEANMKLQTRNFN